MSTSYYEWIKKYNEQLCGGVEMTAVPVGSITKKVNILFKVWNYEFKYSKV